MTLKPSSTVLDFIWNLIIWGNMEELDTDGKITMMLEECYLGV
jgi:hypothetical protein